MNLTARQWLTVLGLAAFLWILIAVVFIGILTLAVAMGPVP